MQQLIERTISTLRRLESFNPFAMSHYSDTISTPGVEHSPTRGDFKRKVAKWYRLESPDNNQLVDMLGVTRPFSEVTLAHIYPASYTNFGEFAAEMSLPSNFNSDVRNFLLLPRHLHVDFDHGYVALIPSINDIRIRVLQPDRVSPSTMACDGQTLYLPAAVSEHRLPYMRVLGWMAWLARGKSIAVIDVVEHELERAVVASHSHEGNEHLAAMLDKAACHGLTRARTVA